MLDSSMHMSIYEFYERRVIPHLLDVAMLPLERYRGEALANARGRVLEIGFGTGLNLPFYPSGVTDLTAVDPMVALPMGARRRINGSRFPVHHHAVGVDEGLLPFAPETFDCATVTWSLCSIADPIAGLLETLRVLRPSAPLLFVEHGLSDNARVARWQNRLNGLWQVLACGCHLNRRMDQIIESGGFHIETLRRFDVPGLPRTHGHLYLGIARAPSAAPSGATDRPA
jgi:SAM-dependent methyltransferase